MHCPPGDQPPLHVHEREDEGFYVLSGSLTLWVGDADAREARAGRVRAGAARRPAHLPGGRRGRASRSSPPPRAAFVGVPARGRHARCCAPSCPCSDGPPDVERLARIAAAHGITLLGPPGMLPARAPPSPTAVAALGGAGPGRGRAGARAAARPR